MTLMIKKSGSFVVSKTSSSVEEADFLMSEVRFRPWEIKPELTTNLRSGLKFPDFAKILLKWTLPHFEAHPFSKLFFCNDDEFEGDICNIKEICKDKKIL